MNSAYLELVDFIASGPSRSEVAKFQASDIAKARVADLIRREKTEGLSEEEKEELEQFLQLEHLMRLAKARARIGARITCPSITFPQSCGDSSSNALTGSASVVSSTGKARS